jgi:hypothetical protein
MGEMRDKGGDFVTVYEKKVHGELCVFHSAYEASERRQAFRDFDRSMPGAKRKWIGDVFFDHVRGTIDRDPKAGECRARHPFLLVCRSEYFDWDSIGSGSVTEYDSAAELIAEAEQLVASERAAGVGVSELWEVYGVRVLDFRESWF